MIERFRSHNGPTLVDEDLYSDARERSDQTTPIPRTERRRDYGKLLSVGVESGRVGWGKIMLIEGVEEVGEVGQREMAQEIFMTMEGGQQFLGLNPRYVPPFCMSVHGA